MQHSHGRGGGERRGGMTRRERRRVGDTDQRVDVRIGQRRTGTLGRVLDHERDTLRDGRRGCGDQRRRRDQASLGRVTAGARHREQRPLDPPGRCDHERSRERVPVELMDQLDRGTVELSQPMNEFAQCGQGIDGM
jgi:hypothetical protein